MYFDKPYLIVSCYGAWRNSDGRVIFFTTEEAAQSLCRILNEGAKDGTTYTVELRTGVSK